MERIEKQPALLKRFEQLLSIVENSTGDIQKANEAEMRVIKELREMGNEALTACAASHGERTRRLVVPRRCRSVVLSESER